MTGTSVTLHRIVQRMGCEEKPARGAVVRSPWLIDAFLELKRFGSGGDERREGLVLPEVAAGERRKKVDAGEAGVGGRVHGCSQGGGVADQRPHRGLHARRQRLLQPGCHGKYPQGKAVGWGIGQARAPLKQCLKQPGHRHLVHGKEAGRGWQMTSAPRSLRFIQGRILPVAISRGGRVPIAAQNVGLPGLYVSKGWLPRRRLHCPARGRERFSVQALTKA
mmetsp:Transcript_28797/g.81116  ORF Transcript_28797/g.81116 Transcript_28797/m.81116 type:complete len:221 (+) Transcript_28797:628-1290(+)